MVQDEPIERLTPLRIGVLITHAPKRAGKPGAQYHLKETSLHDDTESPYYDYDSSERKLSYADRQNIWTFRAIDDATATERPKGPLLHVADPTALLAYVRERLTVPDIRRGDIVGVQLRNRPTTGKINDKDTLEAAAGRAGIKWQRGQTVLPAVVLASDNGLHNDYPDVVWPFLTVVPLVDSDALRKDGAPTVKDDRGISQALVSTLLMTLDYSDVDALRVLLGRGRTTVDRVDRRAAPFFNKKRKTTQIELHRIVEVVLGNLQPV